MNTFPLKSGTRQECSGHSYSTQYLKSCPEQLGKEKPNKRDPNSEEKWLLKEIKEHVNK
jgi:hypothetical protein